MSWMIDDLWSSRYPVHPTSRLLMDCLIQDLRTLFWLRAFGDALPNPLETLVLISHRCDIPIFIELDYGKIYRKALYLMVKTMVSCKFSLKPIQ